MSQWIADLSSDRSWVPLRLVLVVAAAGGCLAGTSSRTDTKPATVWIEAEDAVRQNFDPGPFIFVRPEDGGASGGQYLRLHVRRTPDTVPKLPFYAEYEFDLPADGVYHVWISGSEQDSPGIEPCFFRVDHRPFQNLRGRKTAGGRYGTKAPWAYFGWFLADTVSLEAGRHRVRIEVRTARTQDSLFAAFIDALVLTTDATFVPEGNHPACSPHPRWSAPMEKTAFEDYARQVERSCYRKRIELTSENVSNETAKEVRRKIMSRPLPQGAKNSRPRRFGLHGMSYSFVEAGKDEAKTAAAYELLARAGVESFRTTESWWFQLGEKFDNFKELDCQVGNALKYGQTLMFMTGYPHPKFAVASKRFSAVKPECESTYREYVRSLFNRYKGIVDYAELGNEVDAPEVWWQESTPEMYVKEMRILNEELRKIDPNVKITAFAATYSRDEKTGQPNGGRAFVRKCLDLGIDRYVDAYSMHYTWSLSEKDFPAFFRRELARRGGVKPLINSEESAHGKPYDIVKMFARDFFVYRFERVDYYLARDWFETGRLAASGLFDIDWNPKLRLLAYALSVDAMKDRRLVGLSEPAKGVEAYVLEYDPCAPSDGPAYSVMMWNRRCTEDTSEKQATVTVGGVSDVVSAWNWRLDPIPFDADGPLFALVGDEPIVVFANEKPKWNMMSPQQWLDAVTAVKKTPEALVPGQ